MPSWYSVIKPSSNILGRIPCTDLKGVGPKLASLLKKLDIVTVQDLLFHLPFRYEDRTVFKSLNQLQLGENIQIEGTIVDAVINSGKRRTLVIRVEDDTGSLSIRFFNFNSLQVQLLQVGKRIQCYGEIRRGIMGYEMIHPEYSLPKLGENLLPANTLTAIYPTTEGLHQYHLRKIVVEALLLLQKEALLQEYLPQQLREKFNMPSIDESIKYIHQPPASAEQALLEQGLHPSQQRLVFEELLAHQLSLARIKLKNKRNQPPLIHFSKKIADKLRLQLPFQLTTAQLKVIDEIFNDLQGNQPMLRLVQGDVGSGKTVVAAMAAAFIVSSGFQVAIMAPTELLAEQHYHSFSNWFQQFDIKVALLTSSTRVKFRADLLQELANNQLSIVIGTHALFQKDVQFACLGLIIIDEQHRFGVQQRLALLNKGANIHSHPHQLIMSATPIPRTLAMSVYADLDCSTIDELPPGRIPIKTIVVANTRREQLISRIREQCQEGAQVYWVCTLIEESELLQCQAAEELTRELTVLLPELRIDMVHGRMKILDKERVMKSFKTGDVNLLVATTVIEVGVDVPNASLMIIENAERLGLAQLHQLRGRVGRGGIESHCVLMYQHPLSKVAAERLAVLRNSNDGFEIAKKDLELRGPGEVLGTKQTGVIQFKIANLMRDQNHLPEVQSAANIMLQEFPESVEPLVQRWLAKNDQFSDV